METIKQISLTLLSFFMIVAVVMQCGSDTQDISPTVSQCIELRYFDPKTKKIVYDYTQADIQEDTIIAVYPLNAPAFYRKDILEGDVFYDSDISDVTVKNGVHYHIHLIQDGKCGIKAEMDELKSEPSEYEPDHAEPY